MTGMANKQNPSNLAGLLQGGVSLASLFTSKKETQTRSGSTTTEQVNMDQAGLDAVLRQILEGASGLGTVARGQRQAGLFNSSTNQLLLNDLITRASGEVAKINAPKVTTRTPETVVTKAAAALPAGKSLGALSAAMIGNKLLKEFTGSKGASKAASAMGNPGGFDDTGLPDIGGFMGFGGGGGEFGSFDMGGSVDLGGFSDFYQGGNNFDMGGSVDLGGFSSAAGAAGGWGNIINTAIGLTGDDPGAALERGVGTAVGAYVGGPVGAWVGGQVAEPVFEAGYDVLGGIEDAFYDVGKAVGCFITTATCKLKGKPDNCDELQTLRAFRDTWLKEKHPEAIQEYYDVAPAIVDAISARADAEEVFNNIYNIYIVPAVAAVKDGRNDDAYDIYSRMVLSTKKFITYKPGQQPAGDE